jgi:hypothetical protein
LWPYLVLVAIPTVAFVLPELIGGHLLITGDNLQQNYPLHVLVGSMMRHGQLPFWNQYIFSGTPLMADFNAGAFYPLVGLFVVLPDRVAWIATEVILFSAIAVGMYVFLRALALSVGACILGAATFAFAGPVLNQVNHIDMTEGFVAIPWMLLAVLHITRDGRWRWSILLGIGFATVILAGAPEAMLDEALLVIAYAAISAGFDRTSWLRVLSRGAAGAALALSLAAIQWLPGLEAIRASQRGTGVFAAAGSYPTPFSILYLVPYINGGYDHRLGEVSFFSQYNLPEVGVYLGVLPLVAVLVLLHPRFPSRIPPRDRLTWYLVGLFGYLLALGSNTPLEHLFNALPLYGHQRLQSRNMITVATAVCVLFAGWIDRTERPRQADGPSRYERVAALVPLGLVAALFVWAMVSPAGVVHIFAGVSINDSIVSTVREAIVFAAVLSGGAAALVWLRPKLSPSWWVRLAAAFVAVDLGIMAFTSQLVQTPPNDVIAGDTPTQQLMAAHLPAGGRMVNYDPQTYNSYPGSLQGIPDLNIIPKLPSVSGYASIVNGNYEGATHTHEQNDLDVGQLASGTLDNLNLSELVTVPEYFLVPLDSMPRSVDDIRQVNENIGTDPVLSRGFGVDFNETAYPFYPAPRAALASGGHESWFFGGSFGARSATLILTRPVGQGVVVRFGELTQGGATKWGTAVTARPGTSRITVALPQGDAVGLTLQVLGTLPAHRVVVSVDGRLYELGGSLSSAVVPERWHQAGTSQGYAVFVFRKPPEPISAVTATGQRLRVVVLSSTTKSEQVRVQAPASGRVIRSVAWDSGWTGSVSVNGGPPRTVEVGQFNLIQEIRIPPGNDVVTFHYRPPHLVVASILSLGATAFLVVLLLSWLVTRRSRRPEEREEAERAPLPDG